MRSLRDEGHVWRAWTGRSRDVAVGLRSVAGASRERGLPVMEVRRYDEHGSIEESGTWVRVRNDSWQRCNE